MLPAPLQMRVASAPLPEVESGPGAVQGDCEGITRELEQRDFMQLMAHELRNPLTSIIAYAQRMQRSGAYDAKALTIIESQAHQINRLLNDLLDHARLETGELRLQRTECDLMALALGATQRAQLLSTRHQVCVDGPTGPLLGWWDRSRLDQVFANLLGNAIKYSPEGGEVLLLLEPLGSTVRVTVEDQGVGVAPEALSRLFERAYRAPATAGRMPGLGLGLYVTKALVEAHGGAIQVESLLGYGTAVSFTLPTSNETLALA
jgi:signal transduction histidine kinase